MPLASTFSLQWFGPAVAACVVNDATATASGDIKGRVRPTGTLSGTAVISLAKPTRLVNRPATLSGSAAITTALPKGRVRPTATIKVNALSQDDVTGAVLEAFVEPGLTLRQALVDARKAAKLAAALSA